MAKTYKEIKDIRRALTFRNHALDFKKDTKKIKNNLKEQAINRVFKLTDYYWSEDFDLDDFYNDGKQEVLIPKIILTEFQPQRNFRFEKVIKSLTSGALGSAAASFLKGGGIFSSLVGESVKTFLDSNILSNYSIPINFDDGGKPKHPILEFPVEMVKKMLGGQYLNVFEIPFFGNSYLKADTSDSWSTGGSEQVIGDELQQVLSEDYKVNFPMAPVWQKTGPDNFQLEDIEFYLINKDSETLFRNFQFLHAFISGNFWIQAGLIQKSPNLYDIEIPGRMHLYFCAMGVTVNYVGRNRINPEITNRLKNVYKVYGLPDADEMLYPDAYQISVTIKSLVPNNFNMYLDYLYNKEKTDEVYISNKITRKLNEMAENLKNSIKEKLNPFD